MQFNVRENTQSEGFKKYVGFFKGDVVALNPDREDLNKLLGSSSDKELDYLSEKDGSDQVKLTYWIEADGHQNLYIPHTIKLTNDIRRNNDGDKIQLINQVGDTAWVVADNRNRYDDSKLFQSFTNFTKVGLWRQENGTETEEYVRGAKPVPESIELLGEKTYRPALYGEEELMRFVKAWLGRVVIEPGTSLLVNTDKLFAGNYKELVSLVGSPAQTPFTALAWVKVDDEDPDKVYQRLFREFLPGDFMKYVKLHFKFGTSKNDRFAESRWAKFEEELNGKYGPDGDYSLEPLHEFSRGVTNSVKTKADEVKNPTSSKF